jgi:hypothetical protein
VLLENNPMRSDTKGLLRALCLVMAASCPARAADTLDQWVAGAKKEPELNFIAGAGAFGGPRAISDLEAGLNKKFALNARIRFAAGPEMNAMAARVITELKNGNKSSTDIYHGSQSHFSLLHREKALEQVNWSGVFPWISKPMEIFPNEGVLVFTSLRGILYNSNLIPRDKAPKTYEDLVDPRLSPTWAGKLALPPYVSWLVELSMIWSEERVKNFTRKLVALSGGRLRYGEEERVVSGEFPIAANMGGAVEEMWKWQAKGAPWLPSPLRPRFCRLIFNWACRKIPRIPAWRNYLSPLWLRRTARRSWKNTSPFPPIWLRARRWRNTSAIPRSRCKSPKTP